MRPSSRYPWPLLFTDPLPAGTEVRAPFRVCGIDAQFVGVIVKRWKGGHSGRPLHYFTRDGAGRYFVTSGDAQTTCHKSEIEVIGAPA